MDQIIREADTYYTRRYLENKHEEDIRIRYFSHKGKEGGSKKKVLERVRVKTRDKKTGEVAIGSGAYQKSWPWSLGYLFLALKAKKGGK